MINYNLYAFIFIFLLVFFPFKTSAQNKSVSLEACDIPGWYIGVDIGSEEASLLELNTELAGEYTTFIIIPGLDNGEYVSFQSANDTNYFLIQHDQNVKLWKYSAWSVYRRIATFIMEQGLADINNQNLVSFRVMENPDLWIRHKDGKLFVEESDDSELFKKNATFIIKPPNWDGKNKLSKERTGKKSFSSSRKASLAAFVFFITLVLTALAIVIIHLLKRNGISEAQERKTD